MEFKEIVSLISDLGVIAVLALWVWLFVRGLILPATVVNEIRELSKILQEYLEHDRERCVVQDDAIAQIQEYVKESRTRQLSLAVVLTRFTDGVARLADTIGMKKNGERFRQILSDTQT